MKETNEQSYHGLWFIPGDDRKLQGHLEVSDYYIQLLLTDPNFCAFDNIERETIEAHYPVIYGTGHYGEKLTLYDVSGFSGSFEAKLLLVGDHHLQAYDQQTFRIMSVHVPLFDRWISNSSFKQQSKENGFAIHYDPPNPISFDLDQDIRVEIEFACFQPSTENTTKVKLNEFAFVKFISQECAIPLAKFLKYLTHFQQLASFLARDGANISAARLFSDERAYAANKFLGTMIHGLYPFNKFQYSYNDRHWKYLIKSLDIKDNLQSFFASWFKLAENGQHIIKLFFLDYFYKGEFDENNFLNLVRSLEIFHAYQHPTATIMEGSAYDQKVNDILESVPEKYKTEMADMLKFKNELNLNKRLKALVAQLEGKQIGLDYKFDKKFINRIKDGRNYYTHYNPVLKKSAPVGKELIELTEGCRALLNFLLLKHLGVPSDVLTKRFEYYYEHSYYSNFYQYE